MRAALVLLLMVPVAAAGDGRTFEHDDWTQFIPDWLSGPQLVHFGEHEVDVPNHIAYATDGATWFYASNETPSQLMRDDPPCTLAGNVTGVVLSFVECDVALHPGVACHGTDVCAMPVEGPPVDHPAESTVPLTPVPSTVPTDTCGKVRGAYCTPMPTGVLLAAAGVALLIARGRGRA